MGFHTVLVSFFFRKALGKLTGVGFIVMDSTGMLSQPSWGLCPQVSKGDDLSTPRPPRLNTLGGVTEMRSADSESDRPLPSPRKYYHYHGLSSYLAVPNVLVAYEITILRVR